MGSNQLESLPDFLEIIGLDEEPLALFYIDEKPHEGFSPKPADLPTREKETNGEIDWQTVFNKFSCVMGHIRRARMKHRAAYFSSEQFGCPGGAFWLGFNKPQTETIINYVSTGSGSWSSGERYCESPDALGRVFNRIDPRPSPKRYCVVTPVSQMENVSESELIVFFARPESLCGLHQLAFFVTNDPEVVVSPWAAGCGSIAAWPLRYLSLGMNKAVLGGWDPSARQYFKNDELSFTVPFALFSDMLNRYQDSFLLMKEWKKTRKKIARSKRAWGEAT